MILLLLEFRRAAGLALTAIALMLSGCRDERGPSTSQPFRQRLGEYLSDHEPIEYVYVPTADNRGQTGITGGENTAKVRHITYLPGTEQHGTLIAALRTIGLTEPLRHSSRCGVTYADAPGVWGLERVPGEPTVHFSLLRQKHGEQTTVAIAVGRAGLVLIERRGERPRKFRADCSLFEWLLLARPLESAATSSPSGDSKLP